MTRLTYPRPSSPSGTPAGGCPPRCPSTARAARTPASMPPRTSRASRRNWSCAASPQRCRGTCAAAVARCRRTSPGPASVGGSGARSSRGIPAGQAGGEPGHHRAVTRVGPQGLGHPRGRGRCFAGHAVGEGAPDACVPAALDVQPGEHGHHGAVGQFPVLAGREMPSHVPGVSGPRRCAVPPARLLPVRRREVWPTPRPRPARHAWALFPYLLRFRQFNAAGPSSRR
jgi:hypothetical protein